MNKQPLVKIHRDIPKKPWSLHRQYVVYFEYQRFCIISNSRNVKSLSRFEPSDPEKDDIPMCYRASPRLDVSNKIISCLVGFLFIPEVSN